MTHFTWEEKYKRTWEIQHSKAQTYKPIIEHNKRCKKAVIRHLHIAIDKSTNIDSTEFLPSYRIITREAISKFKTLFKEENPLSTLSIYTNDKDYELLKPGNSIFSIYEILEESYDLIKRSSSIKEMILINYSITIKDRCDPNDLIELFVRDNIKISVISFPGEIKFLMSLCKRTGGKYFVPLNGDHLNNILEYFLMPRNVISSTVNLLKIGFPKERVSAVCTCHSILKLCYKCVNCKAALCELPRECSVCGMLNGSNMSVDRNVCHLYGMDEWEIYDGECECGKKGRFKCKCGLITCEKCYVFMQTLNFCYNCQ